MHSSDNMDDHVNASMLFTVVAQEIVYTKDRNPRKGGNHDRRPETVTGRNLGKNPDEVRKLKFEFA